jgi:NHL repeat
MMNETIHAPDFPYDFEWVNTAQPLSLFDDLQGYVLLVHFWTSSNVNSHHVFDTLGYLEQHFADRSFMVVGVHTGKFSAERDAEHVTRTARRYGLRHPIVIDEGGEIWKSHSSRAWPFVTLIDASGHVRFQGAGEPDRERMTSAVDFLLDEAAAEGDEPYSQLTYDENDSPTSLTGLAFPTGLAWDSERKLLWVADSARHRVIAVDPTSGAVQHTVGSGAPGAGDGGFIEATFFHPQGLLVAGNAVLVADTGNHLLRRIDLDEGRVDSVLGTGRPVVDPDGGGAGPSQPINSPWGLCLRRDDLFVSMAGVHQIWHVALDNMTASPFAGNDTKGLFDGPVGDASLAQPAGMALQDDRLAFVDSDSSSLRRVDFDTGQVSTTIEGGIYKWGDREGAEPKLQSPRAVAWHGDDLILADTLNDKIRRYRDGRLETLPLDVARPEGLEVDGDTLYVADTGNHRILVVDLTAPDAGHEVMPITGLPRGRTSFGSEYERCASVTLPPLGEGVLRFELDLPADAMLQPGTRARLDAENLEGHPLLVDVCVHPDVAEGFFMARGVATGEEGEGTVRLRLVYATCHEPGRVCHVHERRFDLPVNIMPGADEQADVTVAPPA